MHFCRSAFARVLFLVVLAAPLQLAASTAQFQVLLDTDNNTSTGCSSLIGGTAISGVEQILTTTVNVTSTGSNVTGVTRQVCAAGSFGSPIVIDATGWPVGTNGASGNSEIETHIPLAAFGGSLPAVHRLYFAGSSGTFSSVITTHPNGNAILYPPAQTRRRAIGGNGRRTIILDGQVGDWNGIPPLVPGGASQTSDPIRFQSIYAVKGNIDLFFRFSVKLSNAPVAVDDTYVGVQGGATNIVPPGVLSNDFSPSGGTLTAILVSQPQHGTVTLNSNGGFTYVNDGSNAPIDHFTYKANDGTTDSNTATVTLNIHLNSPPVATNDSYSVPHGGTLNVPAPGVLGNDFDPDGDVLTAILQSGPQHGTLTLNANGSFTYTHDGSNTLSDSFVYLASDGLLSSSATVTITITNSSPAITSPNNTTFTAGSPNSFTVTVTGFPTVVVTETGALPPGVSFNPVTRTLSGTPGINSAGIYPITFTASNGIPPDATQNFTLTVVCPTITVTNPASTTATAGTPFSQTFTQTGASGTATFTTTSALPTGLTLSTAGVLSGTPMQSGTFPIVVKVTDSNNCSGTGATYTLIVSCQTITVTNPATTTGTAGTAFSQTFTQTGAIGAATFTTASALPTGLTLATNGTLSGTPTQTGTFPIVVKVTDSNGCTGTGPTYNLVIGCQTITVTNPATSTGTAGTAFSQTFTQTGAIGGATFTLNSGTLPAGLTLSTAGVLSGTPTVTGSFPITVKVTDGNGCTGTGATYTLVINCQTITVTNPATTTGTVNTPFSQTFTAGNTIGAVTFTTASTLPTGLTLSTAGVLSGTPLKNGTFPIVVKATDANGCFGNSATYTLVIGCQVITVMNPATTTGTISSPFSQAFTASNTIGSVTFTTASTLPAGLSLSTGGVLSGTPTQTGTFPIVVTATDANGCSGNGATYNLVIACQTITVTNPASNTGTVGTPFSQSFTQSGAIGGATFTTASTLPNGITLTTAGLLAGTPTQFGTFPITVTVTDGNGCTGTGATYTLIISCQTITVTNPATSTGTAGTAFSQTFTQSGGQGTVTFTLNSGSLPTGLTLSTGGVLSGTPTQSGTFNITVKATDQNGCSGIGPTYSLVIGCPTITVTNPAVNTGVAGSPFSQTFTQSGAVGGATFTLASGSLPAGLTLAANGTLSGTPTQTGSFPITVKVTDANGCTGTGPTYTLTIACQTITVTNPATSTGTIGTAFSQTFTQSGAIGSATFTLNSGTLPAGLTLSTAGVLSGTPTATGSFPITVLVTDSNGCTGTSATYNLVINCQTITVTNPANATGTINAPFSEQFTESGSLGGATFTINSGTLPSGLTLSAAGLLSGTPLQTGTFPITVKVTDGNGCTGVGPTYTLIIGCQTITVTNPATTTGTVGTPFSQTFTETGGVGTTNFSLDATSSALPTGLTLSTAGVLSGTPTQSGTFNIVVKATDSNGCTGVGPTYSLVIACNVITVTNPGTSTGTVDAPFSQTFTQSGGNGTVTFTLNSGSLPAGLTLSTAGVLSGTPTVPGSFPITVKATDVNGCTGISPTYTLVIACQTITVTNPATTTGTVDAPFSQSFTQSGVGTHTPAVFSLNSGTLPAGLTLSSAGLLSGTPGAPGTFPITVKVTDANGCSGISATYTLVIACQTITVTNPATSTGVFNAPFSQTFTQSGVGTHTPANFTLNSGTLPTGLSLSTAGVLSGTPTQTGTFPITVKVTDSNGCSGTSATYNLAITPNVSNDSYSNLVDNTQAFVTGGATAAPATPAVSLSGSVTANDSPAGGVSVTAGTFATTAGGSVTIAADGTFLYTPKANPGAAATATDSFTYTATSNTGGTATPTSANGTVTLNLVNRVWYVKDNGGGTNGQSQSPFTTLAAVQTAATANDIIFIYVGTTTTTPLSGGLSLQNGAKLWGEAFGLTVNSNVLVAAGATQPRIKNTAGAAVTVDTSAATAGNRQNVEIRGLDLESTTTNGVNVTSNAANVTSVTISGNNVRGAGTQGINLNQSSTGTFGATITATSITSVGNGIQARTNTAGTMTITASSNTITASAGNGVDMQTLAGASALRISLDAEGVTASGTGILINGAAAGTTTITSFASNSISGNTGGTGISVTSATFDANPGTVAFDTVSGGSTVIGVSGNGVGANGMILTTVKGDLSFTDLDIFNDGGTGLFASSAAAFNSGTGTGFRVVVGGGVATIDATAGPAVSLNTVTGTLPFVTIKSATSPSTGVALNSFLGSFSAGSGSSISGATGTSFQVGSSNATITYDGTINSASGKGVDLTSNTGSTISFTGALTMSSGSNNTFNATGGGTVTSTNTNSTLTSTTGTALNVANTTIGASGLIFKSISANGGANGIVLNTTGALGGLTVNGDGANTSVGGNSTGGTIQNMFGANGAIAGSGIYLNNTSNVVLRRITINGTNQNYGIRGFNVNNFTLEYSTVAGTNGDVASPGAPNTAGEGSICFGNDNTTGLTGTGTVTSCVISGGRANNMLVQNSSGTLNRLTITGTTFGLNQTGVDASNALANQSLLVEARTASNPTINVTVTGCSFAGAPGGDVNFTGQTSTTMDVIFGGVTASPGTAPGNVLTNTHPNNNVGGPGLVFATQGSMTFHMQGNTIRDANGSGITLQKAQVGTLLSGFIDNNKIGVAGVANSGSQTGNAIFPSYAGSGTASITITNNDIRNWHGNGGIFADNTGSPGDNYSANFTIKGNIIAEPGANSFCDLCMTNGTNLGSDKINVCAEIGGTTLAEKNTFSGNTGLADIILVSSGSSTGHTYRLPGYVGAIHDFAAINAFVAGHNTIGSGTLTYQSSDDNGAGGLGFVGGATCGTPTN